MNDQIVDQATLLDSLLDQDMTEYADLPTYEVPPNGFYKLFIKAAMMKSAEMGNPKKIVPLLQIDYVVREVVELADESLRPGIKENQEFSESYMFMNDIEKTKAAIKATFLEIGTALGEMNTAKLIPKLTGLEIFATLKQRKDKNDETRVYAQIRDARLA